jgi:sec-independent protein translocase protein TatA
MGLDNPVHLALLLLVMLLVFGAKRLPEMGRSLGDGLRGFKDAVSGTPGSQIDTMAPQPVVPTHIAASEAVPTHVAASEPVPTHVVATEPVVPTQPLVAEPETTTVA